MAAWDACLTVSVTVWPAEWIQDLWTRRNEVHSEIERQFAKYSKLLCFLEFRSICRNREQPLPARNRHSDWPTTGGR